MSDDPNKFQSIHLRAAERQVRREQEKETENRKPRVYISGKITGTTDFMERFDSAEEKLKSRGYAVLNPAKANSYMPEDTTWDEYMKVSLTLLQMEDAIYMLDGWEDSKGARQEYNMAVNPLHLKIMYENA